MDTDMEDRIAYSKLQTVCEIRKGMSQLERVKQRLIGDLEVSDAERRSLSEYRREMDLLLQEKMSHVEELRQIHADINAIEDVMKQCEESRLRRLDSARRLHAEYRPLKLQMDRMRQQLGLQPLPDITELEPELPVNELLETGGDTRACSDDTAVVAGGQGGLTSSGPHQTPGMGFMSAGVPPTSLSVMRINNKQQLSMSAGGGAGQQQQHNIGRAGHSPTAFRQQPPPMKSCLSCHQQIHRNAPICPLCKAKSRSRNPKKPKKKEQ